MRLATIALCLATGACVPALPGGTLSDPSTSGTGGTGGTGGGAGTAVTGGGASTGGSGGRATGGSAVTGAGGTGDPDAPLVVDGGRPANLAVDATNVYWVSRRQPFTLMKAPISGEPPVPLAQVSAFNTWVGTDGESVYWCDGANPTTATTIFKMPSAGGLATRIAMGTDGINRFIVRTEGVYWTTSAGTVMKVDRAGGGLTVLATGQVNATEIAVDDANVYWVRSDTLAIMKVGVSGGDPVELTREPSRLPTSLAVDATHIYWTVQGGNVMWASLADGRSETLFASASGATSLAVDASGVYWTEPTGVVFVGQPTFAAVPRNFAQIGRATAFGLVVDASSVNWIGGGLGSIYRKPK